jgi:hypothetical protein
MTDWAGLTDWKPCGWLLVGDDDAQKPWRLVPNEPTIEAPGQPPFSLGNPDPATPANLLSPYIRHCAKCDRWDDHCERVPCPPGCRCCARMATEPAQAPR